MQPRILVPYDFSPPAEQALKWAEELKRSVGGGAIHLLHVLSPLPVTVPIDTVPPVFPSERDIKQIETCLRDAAAATAPEATLEVAVGTDVAAQILSVTKTYKADLIVMGTHGRGGVKRLVLGSVADSVVRHASCPVVTVRSPPA